MPHFSDPIPRTRISFLSLTAFFFLTFLLPFDARISFGGHFLEDKIRFSDFAFLFFVMVWLYDLRREHRRPAWPPLAWAVSLLFLSGALSLWVARDLRFGLIQLTGFAYLLLWYAVFSDVFQNPDAVRRFSKFWVIANSLIALISLLALGLAFCKITIPGIRHYPHYANLSFFPRLNGFSNNSSSFVFDLHFAILFCLIQWLKDKSAGRKSSLWLLGSFGILFLADFLALSRLIAGTLVSCWILLALSPVKDRSVMALKKAICALSIVLLPVIGIVSIWVLMPVQIHFGKQNAEQRLEILWNPSKADYWLLGRAGVEMFMENPLLGVGFNNYTVRLREYMSRYEEDPYEIYSTARERIHFIPHQVIIGWMAQTGIIGLLAFIGFFGGYFRRLGLAARRHAQSIEMLGLWSISLGWVIQSLFSDFMYTRIFWMILAMGLALAKRFDHEPGKDDSVTS